jgi:two-component system, NtrC family, nitrogen regulation response regulator GlnG
MADHHPVELGQPLTSAPHRSVLLWDTRASRLQRVHRIISACGARPCYIETVSALSHVERSQYCHLAVVALGRDLSSDDLGLEATRSLRRQGFQVICHGEGVQSWPLSIRCRVLLAGASSLLDSIQGEFAQALQRLLAHALQAEAAKQHEQHHIKDVMRKLGSVGESPAIIEVFRTVLRVSRLSEVPLLITGETGTGKELLAQAVHQLDEKRRKGPFIALNCSAISPGLAESELFGHRRGAFTGAERDRKGLMRSAEGGVLFLDEIGELDLGLQAKLLRVLQENRVLGVGEDRETPVSVRVMAATNRDLSAMVRQGTFRADLFHRLNVLTIYIPPLRERPADLPPLVGHFLDKYRYLRPTGRWSVDADFIDALTELGLPGNARQLENLVRWALVNKDDDAPLNLRDLPIEIWQQLSLQGPFPKVNPEPVEAGQGKHSVPVRTRPEDMLSSIVHLLDMHRWNLSRSLQHCERLMLEAALHKTHGSQSHTARLLGIAPRTVYNKVHQYHLHS